MASKFHFVSISTIAEKFNDLFIIQSKFHFVSISTHYFFMLKDCINDLNSTLFLSQPRRGYEEKKEMNKSKFHFVSISTNDTKVKYFVCNTSKFHFVSISTRQIAEKEAAMSKSKFHFVSISTFALKFYDWRKTII